MTVFSFIYAVFRAFRRLDSVDNFPYFSALSLCPDRLRLIDIDPAHQPIEFPPGKISDFAPISGPSIAALST
jgi:hypothetical protein